MLTEKQTKEDSLSLSLLAGQNSSHR